MLLVLIGVVIIKDYRNIDTYSDYSIITKTKKISVELIDGVTLRVSADSSID